MKITTSIRRSIATAILTLGLAYPACAAVCPKGRSGCPSPGRCFLYTDADGNSLCDYTSGSGTSTVGGAGQSQPATASSAVATATPTTTPVPVSSADTVTTTVQNTTGTGLFDSISTSLLTAGVVLFALLSAVLFFVIRRGILGIKIGKTGPALTLSALLSLGLSLMAMSVISGGAGQGMVFALVYLVAGTVLSAYLWHMGVMSRRIILTLALESTLAGFVFLAPIMPLEFIGIVNSISGASSLTPAVIILCAVIALTFIIGRTFCGHICPVGSLQELAYAVPGKKIVIRHTEALEIIRLAVFVVTIIAAVYLIDLMAYTGLFELFSLAVSVMLIIAIGLVLLSVFLYRPVCRVICPFGVLFSILAGFSIFRLRRSETCIRCKKCETACPARVAGMDDAKRECYLCGRCTEACPRDDAISYRK